MAARLCRRRSIRRWPTSIAIWRPPIARRFCGFRRRVGCRCLQLDEVNFTYLCDPESGVSSAAAATTRTELPHIYARMINGAISDVPDDMTITMHLCRGNFQSHLLFRRWTWRFHPVASAIKVNGYFMELPTAIAQVVELIPRFVPRDSSWCWGGN